MHFFSLVVAFLTLATAGSAQSMSNTLTRSNDFRGDPVVKHQEPPITPASVTLTKKAIVRVTFTINTLGDTELPVVVETDNPALNDAAMACVRKWKFRPASSQGLPVDMRLTVAVIFTPPAGPPEPPYQISGGNVAGLPVELQYDTAPQIVNVARAVYPYDLLVRKAAGKATLGISIDEKGSVTSIEIADATQLEFGLAAVAAAEVLQFQPAKKDGKAVRSLLRFDIVFDPAGAGANVTTPDLVLLKRWQKKSKIITDASKLDRPLKPLASPAPLFSETLRAKAITQGEATVDFLVDENGRVALPEIVSATSPEFGYAAAQAIGDWTFEPPLAKKKKAVVRVRQVFRFKASAAE